ncbi:MAG: LysR family transcriptional regulator, partial [Lachnospiraceae bacterium]|nr:LysR family transcriptional regulator [Lachnospiraceae bacterium]
MELTLMRYFERIADYEILSWAALDLPVTKPALSNSLHRLEEEVGTPLFDRIGRRLILNNNGRRLLKLTRQVLPLVDQYHMSIHQRGTPHGTISIGSQIELPPQFIELITGYRLQNPHAAFQMATGSNNSNLLHGGSLDFTLTLDIDLKDRSAANAYLLSPLHINAVMSRRNLLARRSSLRLADLRDETFVFSWKQGSIERTYDRCIEAGYTPTIAYLVDQTLSKLILLSQSSLIGFMYDIESNKLDYFPELVSIPIQDSQFIPKAIYLVWREDIASCKVGRECFNDVQGGRGGFPQESGVGGGGGGGGGG